MLYFNQKSYQRLYFYFPLNFMVPSSTEAIYIYGSMLEKGFFFFFNPLNVLKMKGCEETGEGPQL